LRIKLFILLLLLFSVNLLAQINDQQLGRSDERYRYGLYDFSDPGAINIKVAIWGYVGRPGKYIVPDYTTVSDLLSYAGGPQKDAHLDDLRIYRILENGKEDMIKFSFNDLMWANKIEARNRVVPKLKASDILIVPGSPRLFFTDWFRLGLQVFSLVIGIINLVLLVRKL
jgi:hypothetical protein